MDFLEQVKKTASDVAQRVAQKSTEVVEVSKIKYAVYDLNVDIKKLYTEIGKEVYANLYGKAELSETMQMKCEIIESKLAKIEALKIKEKNLKQHIICPQCGRECAEEDETCPYCGAELAVSVDAEVMHTEYSAEEAEPAKEAEPAEAEEAEETE